MEAGGKEGSVQERAEPADRVLGFPLISVHQLLEKGCHGGLKTFQRTLRFSCTQDARRNLGLNQLLANDMEISKTCVTEYRSTLSVRTKFLIPLQIQR